MTKAPLTRRLGLIAALFASLPACERPATTASAVPTSAPATKAPKVENTRTVDAPAAPSDRQIDADLAIVVGGMLSPDHLGPAEYEALSARYEREPVRYLDRLADVYLRAETDTTHHANLYIGNFLWRLSPRAPKDVERVAARFLRGWTLLLNRVDLEPGQRQRLEDQALLVRVLVGGIDRVAGTSWPPAEVSRACAAPVPGGQGLMVTQDCTCGQPLACSAAVEKGRVVVTAHFDESAPGVCTDCYPGWATCSVEGLTPGSVAEIVVNGKSMGSLRVNGQGHLPYDGCVPAR